LHRILKDIFKILNAGEKRKLWILSITDVILNILDIGFLVLLLWVIRFYTVDANNSSIGDLSIPLFKKYPLLLIVVFFLLFAIKNGIGLLVSGAQYDFVYKVAYRLSRDGLLDHLNGNYSDYVHIDTSVINRKISQQPIEFSHYVLNGMQQIFSQMVLILLTTAAIIIYNPLLFPLLVLFLAPPIFFISFFMKRKLKAMLLKGKIASEKAIQHLQEALSGYVESNIFLKNDFFTNRYSRFQEKQNYYLSSKLKLQSVPGRMIEVFAVFGLLVLIFANYFAGKNHGVGLISLGALMIAVYKIIPGVVKITSTVSQVKSYAYSTGGLSKTSLHSSNAIEGELSLGSLKLEDICFSYPDKIVLRNFSLELRTGELLGISGISGMGKTTLINLILGFLKADSGNIYINGQISNPENRGLYWKKIAYSKQQPFFLHDSLVKNITLQEEGFDKDKLTRVLTATGLDKLIRGFPAGLDTLVTENGKNFSGGQRQRILLARALYKEADLIILDEPFSELDESAEHALLKNLQEIAAEGRMIILITHNLEALNYCNRKYLMDEKGS
jgi:ABC-type multidrug transport system fused ATPase/permease subunit